MKIEEGKFYKTRDGRKLGPAKFRDHGRPYFEFDGPHSAMHHPDGTYAGKNGDHQPDLDLIAEWTDGPVRTVTRTVTETTIEPGHYAGLKVDLSPAKGFVCVGIGMDSRLWSSAELKAAAAVLLELAGALPDGE